MLPHSKSPAADEIPHADLLLLFAPLREEPLPDTRQHKDAWKPFLPFLGLPEKTQSQSPFQMKIQNRHFFSLKKLQRGEVRGEAICQGLRSGNNGIMQSKELCATCRVKPTLCTPPACPGISSTGGDGGKLSWQGNSNFWKAGGWICGLVVGFFVFCVGVFGFFLVFLFCVAFCLVWLFVVFFVLFVLVWFILTKRARID